MKKQAFSFFPKDRGDVAEGISSGNSFHTWKVSRAGLKPNYFVDLFTDGINCGTSRTSSSSLLLVL